MREGGGICVENRKLSRRGSVFANETRGGSDWGRGDPLSAG